jgi:TrkA domain protein
MRVTDTVLPGIGRLHVLGTSAGRCVGVIRHHSDRRELIVYDAAADAVGTSVLLTPEEAHGLGELLGAGGIAGHIARLDHHASGIVTLQVLIGADVPAYDLADAGRHAPGHAAVVAVVRAGQLIADPAAAGPGRDGDIVVVVGTMPDALAVMDALHGRPG